MITCCELRKSFVDGMFYLYDALDEDSDFGEEQGETVGPLGGREVGLVVSGGAVARGQVQSVGRGEFEADGGRVHVGDDGVEERLLGVLAELQDGGQDGVGAPGHPLVVGQRPPARVHPGNSTKSL